MQTFKDMAKFLIPLQGGGVGTQCSETMHDPGNCSALKYQYWVGITSLVAPRVLVYCWLC